MAGTRDRILDTLEQVLLEDGPAAATLEQVAARAGVSKGGLLYHFPSKESLFGGLLARLTDDPDADAVQQGADPVGAYLALSREGDDAYTRSFLAALRLVGVREVDAAGALRATLATWGRSLTARMDDPVAARLVQLVGDGLYLHTLLGEASVLDEQVVARVRTQHGG